MQATEEIAASSNTKARIAHLGGGLGVRDTGAFLQTGCTP
ncbi:hypothetical protein CES85_4459 [Ochrobactrum quorumnocens]|uniref:Uncharacterized protein n=1 Tax=Ochrobactrum quorumnocens TaxID=271865 RepID=A0A248UA54_9HYPH|nr:hypothetical protein CES85_4459 [[Ochrobactrum] quorumnocens]